MMPCKQIFNYLDGRMEAQGQRSFEAHIAHCSKCKHMTQKWQGIENGLKIEAKENSVFSEPSTLDTARLVNRAKLDVQARSGRATHFVAAAASVLIFLGFVAVLSMRETQDDKNESVISAKETTPEEIKTPTKELPIIYETTGHRKTVIYLGKDKIGLGKSTRIEVIEASDKTTRLKLKQGTLACSVAPRSPGKQFLVEAGDQTVRVIGTRFLVTLVDKKANVVVERGTVEVKDKKKIWKIKAGKSLSFAPSTAPQPKEAAKDNLIKLTTLLDEIRVIEPAPQKAPIVEVASKIQPQIKVEKTAPVKPQSHFVKEDVKEKYKTWIIQGNLKQAQTALEKYLKHRPNDSTGWSLLGDCKRKAGNYNESVKAYEKVISLSSGQESNRARFKAAVLMQDKIGDHEGAIKLLDQYLKTGSGTILASKAQLRLAQSLIKINDTQRAKKILEQVTIKFEGTGSAIKAKRLLENIKYSLEGKQPIEK